jgi:hypothetical protein
MVGRGLIGNGAQVSAGHLPPMPAVSELPGSRAALIYLHYHTTALTTQSVSPAGEGGRSDPLTPSGVMTAATMRSERSAPAARPRAGFHPALLIALKAPVWARGRVLSSLGAKRSTWQEEGWSRSGSAIGSAP